MNTLKRHTVSPREAYQNQRLAREMSMKLALEYGPERAARILRAASDRAEHACGNKGPNLCTEIVLTSEPSFRTVEMK